MTRSRGSLPSQARARRLSHDIAGVGHRRQPVPSRSEHRPRRPVPGVPEAAAREGVRRHQRWLDDLQPALRRAAADLLGDLADLHLLGEERIKPPCPLFDWYVKPHLDSPSFRNRDEAWADRLAASGDFPLYLLDDDSAIRVRGDKVDVVSTGRWRLVGP